MVNMNCCYKCPRREIGCSIDCPDWKARQAVIEKMRKDRQRESMLNDHDHQAYMNFKREAHNKIKRRSREGR